MADLTKTMHRAPYAAIDPTQPALSQAGRTMLVTGGGTGIGLAISRAFVAADASRIVLVSRRRAVLEEAREQLLAGAGAKKPEILVEPCDFNDAADAARLWDDLARRGVSVDVLVLNAAATNQIQDMLKNDDDLWTMFETNVHANMRMAKRFVAQGPAKGKVLINVSTLAAHLSPAIPSQGSYSSTKMAFTATLQWIGDTLNPEETRVVSYHPGAILTAAARDAGFDTNSIKWDHEDLPAHFAVWLASPEAAFLHTRFVWSHWDVDELKAMKDQIESHSGWLRMGLQGPTPIDGREFTTEFFKVSAGA